MSYIGTTKIGGMHLGNTEIAKAYLGSSLVHQKKGVEPVVDYSREYLTLTALNGASTISIASNNSSPNIRTIYYSINNGSTWLSMSPSTSPTNIASLDRGQSVLLKGTQSGTSNSGYIKIDATGDYSASGNVMSLIFGDNFIVQTSLSGKDYAFYDLFNGSTHLANVDNLVLPATTLSPSCYRNMFRNTSITSAPELPATSLTDYCYGHMFRGCSLLQTTPNLPATTLSSNCYRGMFFNSGITSAPDLPAMTVPDYAYYTMFRESHITRTPHISATSLGAYACSGTFYNCTQLTTFQNFSATTVGANSCEYMFYGCTALVNVPQSLPATTLAASCYKQMFDRCSALTTAPNLPATTLATSCYKWMFEGCFSLVNVPESLPATTLATECYYGMFIACASMVVAPTLPALTLVSGCYVRLFAGCSSLTYIKAMFTTMPSTYTDYWVFPTTFDSITYSFSSSGTFVKNASANWNVTGYNGVPEGWTIETAIP